MLISIAFLLAALPLFSSLKYFEDFYSRSGVCLAFHLTSQRAPVANTYPLDVHVVAVGSEQVHVHDDVTYPKVMSQIKLVDEKFKSIKFLCFNSKNC